LTFDHFKSHLETQLSNTTTFELLEFHYLPYAFGSGLLAYRIKGQLHKFIYDGKDNQLSWFTSTQTSAYETANFELLQTFKGLDNVKEIVGSLL